MNLSKKFWNIFCFVKIENYLWYILGAIPFAFVGLLLGIMIGAYVGTNIGGMSGELFKNLFPWDFKKKPLTLIVPFKCHICNMEIEEIGVR